MIIYKCDRCGKMMKPSDRFFAYIGDMSADLCQVCNEDYLKNRSACDRQYKKGLQALAYKYGMVTLQDMLTRGDENDK